MILLMVLAATKPSTHCIAPPLLAAEVVYLVALAVRYYRRIQVPHYLWTLQQQQQAESRYPWGTALQQQGSAALPGEVRQPPHSRAA